MNKVSVIIPAYNAEKYLEECLESVCGQTYQKLEIIVVDDGSKDATASIIKKYVEQDKRIVPCYNENHGVSYSRNFALDRCTGEYVTFVDSDDVVALDFVEQMVHDIETFDADMAAVGVAKSETYQPEVFTTEKTVVYENTEVLKGLFGTYEGFVCNKLYRRSLLQTNRVRLEQNIAICEDLLFNVIYLRHCPKVTYNGGLKYFYRQVENSASNRLDNPRWFDILKAYQRILPLVEPYSDIYPSAAFQYAMTLCAAKYRLKFIDNYDENLKHQIDIECSKIRPCWSKFSAKQRLKLFVFSVVPGAVVRYQRRKL